MQRYANDDGVVMTTPLGDTRLMSPVDDFRKCFRDFKAATLCSRGGGGWSWGLICVPELSYWYKKSAYHGMLDVYVPCSRHY